MSILLSIVTAILTFFLSALALKLALRVMGQPAHENKYGTAVTIAAMLSVGNLLLGFFPFFVGWILYPIMWLVMVKSVYHISFTKSVAVSIVQALIRGGLLILLGLLF